jgi:hypothetical protein
LIPVLAAMHLRPWDTSPGNASLTRIPAPQLDWLCRKPGEKPTQCI